MQVLPVTVTCPPALENATFVQSRFNQEASLLLDQGFLHPNRRRQVTIRMRLARTGEPWDTEVVRSSGVSAIDQAALRVAVAMQFLPAILGR